MECGTVVTTDDLGRRSEDVVMLRFEVEAKLSDLDLRLFDLQFSIFPP